MRAFLSIALLLAGALGAGAAEEFDPTRNAYVTTQDPLGEPVTKVVYLKQGWTPEESVKFYFTTQGSQIIPYDWFLALEQADSTTPFRDNQNILRYRYLPQNPGPMNPDGLPVGFAADRYIGTGPRWLGMTCAACHTAEVRLGTTAYRVDGGPTHADIQGFLTALSAAMQQTLSDPAKFERFADKVLRSSDNPANRAENRAELKSQLEASIQARVGFNLRNFPGYVPTQKSIPRPTHYARLDAFGSLANEVYHHAVKCQDLTSPTVNTTAADAPTSYPCLWDTPQHDKVQWLGVAQNGGPLDILSLSRNVGEALGAGGDFVIPEYPTSLIPGYASSVKLKELGELENLVKTLWSPQWPDDFPQIDKEAAEKGALLYETHCLQCHALIDRKDPGRVVEAVLNACGTDPKVFNNFHERKGPSGKLNGVHVNFIPFGDLAGPKIPPVADSGMMIANVVIGAILGRFTRLAPPGELSQVRFQAATVREADKPAYKARPLNGIWATAPYLHNGSVPNLDALLRPVVQRPTSFSIGVRTFDPVRVGYLTDADGFPRFTVNNPAGTPITGNSNAGHEGVEFGTGLGDEERRQLIEYLKTL